MEDKASQPGSQGPASQPRPAQAGQGRGNGPGAWLAQLLIWKMKLVTKSPLCGRDGGGRRPHGHERLHIYLGELGPQGTWAHGTARGSSSDAGGSVSGEGEALGAQRSRGVALKAAKSGLEGDKHGRAPGFRAQ